MSKPTKILIKEFGLQSLLRERVFVTWEDQSGTSRVLGCRSDCNGQNLEFFIAAYYDMEGHVHIHLSLQVSIINRGNKQIIELLLIVPPDADLADASGSQIISNIDKLSHYHASAIHDAGISNSTHVICIPFNLVAEGFVVMKKKQTTMTIKASNQSSKELIRNFQSLSITKTFTVYIKPNDYALVGLKDLRNRLTNTGTPGSRKTITKEMYIRQALELVEWSRFDAISPPPAYIETPQLFPEIQVPRSPPMVFEQKTPLLIHTVEATIAETPTRTPISSNHTLVHGIFSSSCEELPDNEVNLDDIEEDARSMEMEMNFNVDSDEEQLAILKSRELSQEFNYDLEVLQILDSKLLKWIQTAIRINSNVYEHNQLNTKLTILGSCVRTSNTGIFDATMPWCSALFFYDPFDSDPDNTLGLWKKRNSWLISDIVRLIQWANRFHYGAEMNPLLLKHFRRLGDTARTIALNTKSNKDEYDEQKGVCMARVLVEFGKPGISTSKSTSKGNSKSVFRHSLGTDSNGSKRVKM
ncbi:hypothetical protein BOTCAL_0981g00020 [Botryotinia calthae]|uniref:Uncharacterized protein n=1 Tax=Botryotinia calthae TaxID=38488 RepID=A0A4Y8CG37_9HELO|nr:hypothetical protein BOTCAL_0981g00020 [Botryotinia calthae]